MSSGFPELSFLYRYARSYAYGNSRSRYVEFVRRCDEASLLRCITNAFEYYGGIPDTVLTDHMKTVVVSSDNGKPVWHKTFERFATDMCFVPKLCRVRRPQTKGKVERLVHYVRDNFLPGRAFTDMGDLQQQARQWCDRANGKIHGTTGERPVEMLAQEHLKPLPNEAILRQYRWESRKVSREGFVSYDGALYGVSWIHSGKTVLVSRTGTQVQISDALGEVLEIHEVCHRSRKHVPAQRQYVGLAEQNGIPHVHSCARQISSEDVEIRPLAVYEQITEVG